MKTYKADVFLKAQREWAEGSFGPEWDRIREAATQAFSPFPPRGTAYDDREAAAPSQRAIVYRSLKDRPRQTEAIVRRSVSWSQVIGRIFEAESGLRAEIGMAEEEARGDSFRDPGDRHRLQSIRDILRDMAS